MSTNRASVKGLDLPALEACLASVGETAPFRARQVFQWIHGRGATSFAEMTDLPKPTRARLDAALTIGGVEIAEVATSVDGTRKIAIRLEDGAEVESVIIPERDRFTLCVSTQVGCALGCRFCFTGVMGWGRQMAAHEIVDQLYQANRVLADRILANRAVAPDRAGADHVSNHEPSDSESATGGHRGRVPRITHVVFMGMGEPLANFDATLTALRLMTNPIGAGLSTRRITVSTVGLVPELLRLGHAIPVNLAVSLHAPNDEIRGALMPINKTYPIDALLNACRNFPLPLRRRITFEYVLLAGINDAPSHARELARRLHGVKSKVNLIVFNPFPGAPYDRPTDQAVETFRETLVGRGITATVRQSRGRDVFAACGQLANVRATRSGEPIVSLEVPKKPKLSTAS
ncbi:MAG: 23S rRNA (adenine(2503)-C(2))-methyltransferase RlmN [Deltaproteobacteria bacterium]|nr:23S rRNA (adenine(2503)-C(2))-methyltransferase RlmN [Deltaproteobacteria bacterium]